MGALAVFLPVLAVGALSWAAAQDDEERVHSFRATLTFREPESESDALDRILRDQDERSASGLGDARDARRAIEAIKQELLGETAEWYTRRTFGGVA